MVSKDELRGHSITMRRRFVIFDHPLTLVMYCNKSSTTHPTCYVIFRILKLPINVSTIH